MELGGSVFINNNEASLRTGGDSIVITLSGEAWSASLGEDNDTTTNLLNSFSGTGDWSVIRTQLDYTSVYRRLDTVVTIILPAVPDYDIFSDETISAIIDETALITSLADIAASNSLLVQHDTITATLSGDFPGGVNENQIRTANTDLVINLSNDSLSLLVGEDNAVTTAILDGISGDQNWAEIRNDLDYTNVSRTDAGTLTISIGSILDYYIEADENITVSLPASAVQNTDYNIDAGGFTITNLGVTVTMSGTVVTGTENDETDIVAGGGTIILTISGDEWNSLVGDADNTETNALFNSFSGDGNWSAVTTALAFSDVVYTTNTLTINLPAVAGYSIFVDETVTVSIDEAALQNSTTAVSAGSFIVEHEPVTAALSGTVLPSLTESEVRSGGYTILLSLQNDEWVSGTVFDNVRSEILDGFSGDQNWNDLVSVMPVTSVVRSSSSLVTITIPANDSYFIGSDESVGMTIPASALLYQDYNVTASPLFSVINEDAVLSVSGSLVPNATEDEVRDTEQTIVLSLDGDTWKQTLDNNNTTAAVLFSGISGSDSWNNQVMNSLSSDNISLTDNDQTLTITINTNPGAYDIDTADYIHLNIPESVLETTVSGSLTMDSVFYIEALPASVSLGGTVYAGTGDNEQNIRDGGESIELVISEDSWASVLGDDNSLTAALISSISGSASWNTVVIPLILGSDQGASAVNVVGNTLTINLPQAEDYEITENDTLRITIPEECFLYSQNGDLSLSGFPVIEPASPTAILVDPLPALEEYSLNGSSVSLYLKDVLFQDASLDPASFQTNYSSSPELISVSSVNYHSDDSATLVISYTGDFDVDITDLRIQIGQEELSSGADLLSQNAISISANIEPEISNVIIPADTFGIGEVVRAEIYVSGDGGSNVYSLGNGSIAGQAVDSISKQSDTFYYGYFTVDEGDTDYLPADLIPVTDLQLNCPSPPLEGDLYNGNIDNNTLIDGHKPIVNLISVSGTIKKTGDQVDLFVSADGTGYSAILPTHVNNVNLDQLTLSFLELGYNNYILRYEISENDDDVSIHNLTANLTLKDIAGNISDTKDVLESNDISIDANSPVISMISVPDGNYTVDDVVEITVTADGADYDFVSGTAVNGVPLSPPDLTGSYSSLNQYKLYYTVSEGDNEVLPGNLSVSVRLQDEAGNYSEFNTVESNSLAVYTTKPEATILGNVEICEDDSTNISVSLEGRFPMNIYINDGIQSTAYISSTADFELKVSPETSTIYTIDSVVDVTGIMNTGSGQANLTVNAKTPVQITNTDFTFAVDSDPVDLEADVSGGTFFGPGVISSTSVFDPGIAGTDGSPHSIIYSYENTDGCVSTDTAEFYVITAQASIEIEKDTFCYDLDEFSVTASNDASVLGSFILKQDNKKIDVGLVDYGNNTATVYPEILIAGDYTIVYSYYDGASLKVTRSFYIEEPVKPEISIITLEQESICQNGEPILLDGNNSLAYFEGGSGIIEDSENNEFRFDPSIAQVGENTIYYIYETENGCENSDTTTITVLYVPEIDFEVEDVCIIGENQDTTVFNNLTPDKYMYSGWTWNFDEQSSSDNYSYEVEGSHSYRDPGNRTVVLTGVTVDNCSSSHEETIDFSNKPVGNIYWSNECWVENDPILFYTDADAKDPINEYRWVFYHSDTDSTVFTDNDSVNVQFSSISDFPFYLYVKTKIGTTDLGCENTFRDTIPLKNTFRLSDEEGIYFNDFEDSDGRWSAEIAEGSDYNSWSWGNTSFEVLETGTQSTAWHLEPPDSSGIIEQSYVLSPCFDLRGVEKPMISVDIVKSLHTSEGVCLQYTTNNGIDWNNLGFYEEGINWYNSFDIDGAPGGQEIGWSGTETYYDDGNKSWIPARRYASSEIGEISNVQFRFIYGAEHSKVLTREGFAFDNFKIHSRTRKVLLEHFSNGNSQEVSEADDYINTLYNTNFSDIVKLEYHSDLPSADLFYNQNPYIPGTRMLYYGVDEMPSTIIDGGKDGLTEYDNSASILQIDDNDIVLESLYDPEFSIDINAVYGDDKLDIYLIITALEDLDADERLVHVAVYERLITGLTLANGQSQFQNVVKDMLPNGAGTAFFNEWTAGQEEQLQYSWSYENVYDPSMLRVAAFIQNDISREVYQSATDDETVSPVGIDNTDYALPSITLYPNPAVDEIYISQSQTLSSSLRIEIIDQMGRTVWNDTWLAQESLKQLDISSFERGMYLLRLMDSKGRITGMKKFTIIR